VFVADRIEGGYLVEAAVGDEGTTAFALVNLPPADG
jgi:hypothetical protein